MNNIFNTITKGLLLVSFCFLSILSFSQDFIQGTVVSETGKPLPKASVFIPNSTVGIYTNDKGEFALSSLPAGEFNFAVSYIGYKVITVPVSKTSRSIKYLIKMELLDNELQAVIVRNYDKGGWKKWGDIFTSAFIGTSLYAGNCEIANKNDIRFIYSDETKQLQAFSNKPLLIDNKDLGYQVEVSLVDFSYNVDTKIVDYQTFCFFKEKDGSDKEKKAWEKNRLKVYSFSLLHFMRSVYAKSLEREGYQISLIERKSNTEKQRVQGLYRKVFEHISDSLKLSRQKTPDINSLVEKSFVRDSLKYYKTIVAQPDEMQKISKQKAGFDDIAKEEDSITVKLDCKNYMQVIYTRSKEPEEYLAYRSDKIKLSGTADLFNESVTRLNPITELNLQQKIPVEINENGSFTNVDLYMNGFWGWWEKLATKLPYEYEP